MANYNMTIETVRHGASRKVLRQRSDTGVLQEKRGRGSKVIGQKATCGSEGITPVMGLSDVWRRTTRREPCSGAAKANEPRTSDN